MVAGAASVQDNPRINLAQPAQRLHYSGPGVQGPASDCDSDSSESLTQNQSQPRSTLPLPKAADPDSSARWIVPATQFHLPACYTLVESACAVGEPPAQQCDNERALAVSGPVEPGKRLTYSLT